jgi:small subunit ribosomal protein S8
MAYTDLLIRIKNAQAAKKPSFKAPFNKLDFAVAELLAASKYIKTVEKKGRGPKKIISVTLADAKTIDGIKFISKSSRRMYAGYRDMRRVRRGFGMAVLSTPKGVLSDKDARKQKVGGEVLFEIW